MTTILYILGSRHCGSTFLDLLVGSAAGATSLGQVGDLYRHCREPEQCTCGSTLDECLVWGHALASLSPEHRAEICSVGPLIAKERNLHRFVASPALCRRYTAPFDAIVDDIAAAAGASLVVDSSKNSSRAIALLRASRHDVRVLNLVRDARGMIASHNRRRDREQYLAPMAEWTAKNTVASTIVRRVAGRQYLHLRYEDLVRDPQSAIRAIGRFAGHDLDAVAAAAAGGVEVPMPHIFRGNRQVRGAERVTFDPTRLESQRLPAGRDGQFWWSGGFVVRCWGYDRRQSYLESPTP